MDAIAKLEQKKAALEKKIEAAKALEKRKARFLEIVMSNFPEIIQLSDQEIIARLEVKSVSAASGAGLGDSSWNS